MIRRSLAVFVPIALLVACSPVFLFQLMQPMSDVPVTAWWLLGIAAAWGGSPVGAGLAASVAILTRANLAPLLLPIAALLVFPGHKRSTGALARLVWFACAAAPGIVLTGSINSIFYGSPLKSGYGALVDIYRWSYGSPNLIRYPTWLWETYSPYIFLGIAIPILAIPGRVSRSAVRFAWLALFFSVTLGACYLFYIPFEHWTYLRFLLPAIPLLLIASAIAVESAIGRFAITRKAVVLGVVATLLPLSYVHSAVRGDAFALKRGFRERYQTVGEFVASHTPEHAAVMCVLQSGSLRYYAQRTTVRYDLIEPRWLDGAVEYLRRRGYAPYVALERTERADFERRFRAESKRAGELTTPSFVIGALSPVTVFVVNGSTDLR